MNNSLNLLHWAPRVLCILAILFVSLFALDSFQEGLSIWQQLGIFLMHLIPSFVLIVLLLIAWKWEKIGGIIFMIIGIGFSPFIFKHNYNMNHDVWMSIGIISIITIPFIVVGILFVISHYKKKAVK